MTNLFRGPKHNSQKHKYLFSAILVSLVIIAFQNCGKANKTSTPDVDPAAEQKPAVLELNAHDSLVLLSGNGEGFGLYAYDVNIASGEVLRTMYEVPKNDPSNKPVKLCLSEEKRVKLEYEFNNSSVCFFKTSNPDMQCIQIYKYPYAIVDSFKLGENASACSDFYDICTGNRANFLSAVKDALAGIDSSLCD